MTRFLQHLSGALEGDLNMMHKYDLNTNELLLIKIILVYENPELKEVIKKYASLPQELRGSVSEMVKVMSKRRLVKYLGNSIDTVQLKYLTLGSRLKLDLLKTSQVLGQELFDAYPTTCTINGCTYRLRRISKKFQSLDAAFSAYGISINWDYNEHQKVLQLIEQGKQRDYAFSCLDNFIVDNDWNNIPEVLEKGGGRYTLEML